MCLFNNYVIINPSENIGDILTKHINATTFYLEKGNHFIYDNFKITRSNVNFIGCSKNPADVNIIQKNTNKDGIVIDNCKYISLKYISVHVPHDNKIALTVANSSNITIENCIFHGNSKTFSIYFAGPKVSQGKSTIDAYNKKKLDFNNIFRKNIIYSNWAGDSVSFSLQKKSLFTENIIRGGKLAVYMCYNTVISNNKIYDSGTNGIYVSLPSNNLNIVNNVISESSCSGIKISNQTEHGDFTKSNYKINISGNTIYDAKFYGIEINEGFGINIIKNIITNTKKYAIYSLDSSNINVLNNKFVSFGVGLWLHQSSNIVVSTNSFYSVYPNLTENIIKYNYSSHNNKFINNKIRGKLKYDNYSVDDSSIDNIISNNNINLFLSQDEEFNMYTQ